jgi:hypothetical protein
MAINPFSLNKTSSSTQNIVRNSLSPLTPQKKSNLSFSLNGLGSNNQTSNQNTQTSTQMYKPVQNVGVSSATPPSPTVITPPKTQVQGTSYTSPAMQNYMNTVYSPTPTNQPPTGMNNRQGVQTDTNGDAIIGNTQNTSTQTPSNSNDAMSAYLAQYSQSIADQNKARLEKANIENKQKEAEVKAREAYNKKLDESGSLLGGARQAAANIERRAGITDQQFSLEKLAASNLLSALSQNQQAGQPIQIGDNLIDPSTGAIIYSKPQEGFSLSEGQARYDSSGNLIAGGGAKGFELGKDQVRYELDPETGQYKQVATGIQGTSTTGSELLSPAEATSLGVPYGTTKEQAFGRMPQKSLTEGESKAKQYGANAQLANNALNQSVYNLGNVELPFVPNMLKSGDRQLFEQNARQFVNAILRRESGATITDSEFLNKQKELIPQAGDSKQVLDQKKIARDLAVRNTIEAGQAFSNQTSSQGGGLFAEEW